GRVIRSLPVSGGQKARPDPMADSKKQDLTPLAMPCGEAFALRFNDLPRTAIRWAVTADTVRTLRRTARRLRVNPRARTGHASYPLRRRSRAMKLTPDQVARFRREGYLFFPGLFSPQETQ